MKEVFWQLPWLVVFVNVDKCTMITFFGLPQGIDKLITVINEPQQRNLKYRGSDAILSATATHRQRKIHREYEVKPGVREE